MKLASSLWDVTAQQLTSNKYPRLDCDTDSMGVYVYTCNYYGTGMTQINLMFTGCNATTHTSICGFHIPPNICFLFNLTLCPQDIYFRCSGKLQSIHTVVYWIAWHRDYSVDIRSDSFPKTLTLSEYTQYSVSYSSQSFRPIWTW